MHSSRTIVRAPQVCRIQRVLPPARNFHYMPTPFVPRFTSSFGFPATSHEFGFPAISQDFAPLFKLLEDMTVALPFTHVQAQPLVYQPRFEIREVEGKYELRGEIPGVEQQDLSIEFSDAQTLVIRGRTTREASNTSAQAKTEVLPEQPSQEQQTVNTQAAEAVVSITDNTDALSTHSTGSYQKPTVEDAMEDGADQAATSSPGVDTPSSSVVDNVSATSETPLESKVRTKQSIQQEQPTSPQYWISERTVGEFQRTFSFARRVDHDSVRATLKNGILNIVVPKASRSVPRRIQIE